MTGPMQDVWSTPGSKRHDRNLAFAHRLLALPRIALTGQRFS